MVFRAPVTQRAGERNLARRGDFTPFSSFQNEMNRLFDSFFDAFGTPVRLSSESSAQRFVPSVDVEDFEDKMVITAELPGLDQKDIDITLQNDRVEISGEKRFEREEKAENGRRYVERSFGSFQRIIPLTAEIDADKVDASFKNGVLHVTLPKADTPESRSRKVSIRS
ncbi:MAG: Hsp20/alpha crystallin family protein [Bdellovibrionales bacterium]|nr:Hsp20/alpha crystallin family protein [Bdellovibrionales bacterium]